MLALFVSYTFICAVLGSPVAPRRDFAWTVTLQVSTVPGSEYEGAVELVVSFDNGMQQAVTLESTTYQVGQKYTFPLELVSKEALRSVHVRTLGFCPFGLLPLDVLRLDGIRMECKEANATFEKRLDDLAIKDVCQSNGRSLGNKLTDFDRNATREGAVVVPDLAPVKIDSHEEDYCTHENARYEVGASFEMNCRSRCVCNAGGVISCVDNCPSVNWAPDQKCHFVQVPGRCCEDIRCEEDRTTSTCQTPVTGGSRFPWSVLLCVDALCTEVYNGVILSQRHVLVFGPDTSIVKQMRVISGKQTVDASSSTDPAVAVLNVTSHADFFPADKKPDSAAGLQILELDRLFAFDRQVQSANLPFNALHCAKISERTCPVTAVGYDPTEPVSERKSFSLHAQEAQRDPTSCRGPRDAKNTTKKRGDQRTCITGLDREDCTGPLGGAVVATAAKGIDFVVGMLDPDEAAFQCLKPGVALALPLCKYVDWISDVVNTVRA